MGSTVNKTGPWIFHNSPDLSSLVDKLNAKLPLGVRVPVIRCDTCDMPHTVNNSGYGDMSTVEPVSIVQRFGSGKESYLLIPIGLGITVPTVPLEWNGETYPAIVDIIGVFINISVPYLFKEVPDRVDVKTYTIVTRDR